MIFLDEITRAEEEINSYYRRLTEINKLKNRVRFLGTEKAKIEKDINESNISLNVSTPSPAFGADSIRGSGISSPQERAIESAFSRLEKQLVRINNEIIGLNADIRDLEYDNCDMGFILDKLDFTAREFIRLSYDKRMGYTKIASIIHMSPSSLSRLRLRVLDVVAKYTNYIKT